MSRLYINNRFYQFTVAEDVAALESLVTVDMGAAEIVSKWSPGLWLSEIGEAGLQAYQRVSAAIDRDALNAMQEARHEQMQRAGEASLPSGRGSMGGAWENEE